MDHMTCRVCQLQRPLYFFSKKENGKYKQTCHRCHNRHRTDSGASRVDRKEYDKARRAYVRARWGYRMMNDEHYHHCTKLRGRLGAILNRRNNLSRSRKRHSYNALIGCSPAFLVKWIESQFTEGMTWDNIHVDHMLPCKNFELKDVEKGFHYTNLQPLSAHANLSKGAKIEYDMKWSGKEWLIRGQNKLYRQRMLNVLC